MLLWITLAACTSSEPQQAPAPAAPVAGKRAKKGKGKGKAREKPQGEGCVAGVHAAEGWSGEYPEPVVDVVSSLELKGRADACDRLPLVSCTVAPGLYHPWAEGELSFATIRSMEKYKVLEERQIGPDMVSKGTIITLLRPLSEGFCMYEIGGVEVEAECPGVMAKPDSPPPLEQVSGSAVEPRQMVQVSCTEGQKAWIQVDDALFGRPEIRRGKVTGMGEIAPGEG